jgi:hypothetical protein
MVLFFNLSEFQENWSGALYLISASLGTFDFSIFSVDESVLQKEYGWVFLILFLIATNIILLNFLIAILSNKYTNMEQKSKVLYLQNILLIKQVQSDNKYYSSLVSFFVPLNIILLPIAPFVIFCKSKKLNKILMLFCYTPMMIIGTIVFFLTSLVLIPFAYLVVVYTQIKLFVEMVRMKHVTYKDLGMKVLWVVTCACLGIFYLPFITIVDTVMFVKGLFKENSKIKHPMRPSLAKYYKAKIDPDLEDLLLEIIELSEDKIDVKSLILYFKKEMKVIEQISTIIFTDSKFFKLPVEEENIDTERFNFNKYFHTQTFSALQNFETKVISRQV